MRRDHHSAGDAIGNGRSPVLADEVQRGIDTRGGTRTGGDRAVVDEEDVGVDLGFGEHPRELVAVAPMCGAASPVEKSGSAGSECSGADRQHPATAVDHRTQGVEDLLRILAGRTAPGNRDEVDVEAIVERVRRGNRHAAINPQGSMRSR